jgi:uncharacterized membrane protein
MTEAARPTGVFGASFVLGFALGGFFDGIMLHQVLQWHHLLSLVPGEDLRRIETQILADGAFHILMYLVTLMGVWLLWRARAGLAAPGGGRRLLLAALLGFAVWNVVDVVGFHWLAGIHRVRVDVPVDERLRWDLLWLALFSGLPLLAAWAAARRSSEGGRGGRAGGAALTVVVCTAGLLALRASPEMTARPVLFRADLTEAQVFSAVAAVDGRVVSTLPGGRLVVIDLPPGATGWRLYRHGALAVGGQGSPAGCLNWTRV